MSNLETGSIHLSKIAKIFTKHRQAGVDTRLIGSWGRAAAVNGAVPDPKGDYGGYRDIDLVVFSQTPDTKKLLEESKKATHPITLETHFTSRIEPDLTKLHYRDITINVDPSIFAKNTVSYHGVSIDTFDPLTLLHLPFLYGPPRPKDTLSLEEFAPLAHKLSKLSMDLFEPFYELEKARRKAYPSEEFLGQLRWQYHSLVPRPIRSAFAVVTVPLWQAFNRKK